MSQTLAGPLLVLGAALIPAASTASTGPFICGVADVCNIGKNQPDQYCTGGPESRCKSCGDVNDRCFTERMAFNCTTHCRELDILKRLEEEKGKLCAVLGNITHGYHNASDDPRPGDIVQSGCDEGYRVQGFGVISCLKYGIWSGELPVCTEIVCTLPEIPHGTVSSYNVRTTVGEYISYSCDEGYGPDDPQSRARCLPDGTWRAATCHRLVYVSSSDTSDCPESLWKILFFGSCGLSVALLITLGLTCMFMRRRSADKDKADRTQLTKNDYTLTPTDEHGASAYSSQPANVDKDIPMNTFLTIDEHSGGEMRKQTEQVLHAEHLPPRDIDARSHQLPADHLSPNDYSSLPSMASSGEFTEPKDVSEPDDQPPVDDRNAPGSNSRNDSCSRSDGTETGQISCNMGQVHVTCNVNVNSSSSNNITNNNNNNNNNSSSSIATTSSNKLANGLDKKETDREEKDEPDYTPFPTQATGEDVGSGNSVRSYSQGGNPETSDNPETDAASTNERRRHAQPVDGDKSAKLMLPNTTVSPADVKRKSSKSKR